VTPRHARRGLTLVEVLIVVAVVVGLLMVAVVSSRGGSRASARQAKCATQVRNIVQAMTIFVHGNDDRYPLPSRFDGNNLTVPEIGRAKDTTANIFSILVFNSSISLEMLVCPSETNTRIKIHAGYENSNPRRAVDPQNALWDPSLSADFTTADSHISYATLITDGEPDPKERTATGRLQHWANTFDPRQACLGNRGPLVTGRDAAGNILHDRMSNTLAIHGKRTVWEGNIGYNDNHVAFEQTMDPAPPTYLADDGNTRRDILFYDEPDDSTGLNACLGIWIKAGTLPTEFKGIHD
jgi:prepilin-type N-terminal cleavage/methylation domain-containing protein